MTRSATDTIALCIPAYNGSSHLPRLFETVRAQSLPFDEILVYDDASTDDTADVARAFGAIVVRGEENVGASIGKNILASRASAHWLHFHDADDALGAQFVERFLGFDGRADADVVLFRTEDRLDATGQMLDVREWNDEELREDAIKYCVRHTITNCGVYRRAAFTSTGGFDSSPLTHYNEDNAMHSRLALAGLRFRAIDYPGVIIYRRQGSMSSGHPIECARAQFEVLSNIATHTGTRYAQDLGPRLWLLAGVLGGYQDWTYVRRCLDLVRSLGYDDPTSEHPAIRAIARVSPFAAVRAREAFIRVLKPQLRRGMPQAQ